MLDRSKTYGKDISTLIGITSLIFIALVFFVAIDKIKTETQAQYDRQLTSLLDASYEALDIWFEGREKLALQLANDDIVRSSARALDALADKTANQLIEHLEQQWLRKRLLPIMQEEGLHGYFIISLDNYTNLASSRNQNLGLTNLLHTRSPETLEAAKKGKAKFSPVVTTDVELFDSDGNPLPDQRSLFVVAPINDNEGQPIALFAIRIVPEKQFAAFQSLIKLGETGQLYLFDNEGNFLTTPANYQPELLNGKITKRLLASDRPYKTGAEGEHIQPTPALTRMAQSATRGETGMDLDGYMDYRGIEVIGAWRWTDEELGLSIEIEATEAYQVLRITWIVMGITLFIALSLFLGFIYFLFQSRREALRLVDERTAELQQHKEHLEELVEEQTYDLRRAKEEAEKANSSKSDFFATVTHELRTPLHAIISFSDMGLKRLEKATPDKMRGWLTNVNTSGKRLLHMVNDLLDHSKLEAGEMLFEMGIYDPVLLSQEAVQEISSLGTKKQLSIQVLSEEAIPEIFCDSVRLHQVLINLLSNAIKYSPDMGKINISLFLDSLERLDGTSLEAVRIEVDNEGPQIPDEELESIFNLYNQATNTDRDQTGTGLGLSICRAIVSQHHGHIYAQNIPDSGVRFVIFLPLQPPANIEVNE